MTTSVNGVTPVNTAYGNSEIWPVPAGTGLNGNLNGPTSVDPLLRAQELLFGQGGPATATAPGAATNIPQMNARSEAVLASVNPQLANRVRLMAADLRAQGIDIIVTSGLRTHAQQTALYAQGRESLSRVNELRRIAGWGSISANENRSRVTNARAGSSLHNYGLAVDVVPLVNGQPNWNVSSDIWSKIGAAGKGQGMEWGGDFRTIVDKPHFQMTGGKSVSDLNRQYNANGGNLPAIWADVNRNYPPVGTNTPPTNPVPPTNPTPPTTPAGIDLRVGSRGPAVAQLQRDLTRLGYPLAADGIFGPKTDAAVRRFQRDRGLTADGIVGPRTRAAISGAGGSPSLPVPTANLRRGNRGEQVKQLQQALVRLGFMTQAQMNTGPGIFGPRTDRALRAFQQSKGLGVDGIYGPRSQSALRSALGGTAPIGPATPSAPSSVSGARIDDILRGTNLAGQGNLIANLSRQYNIPAELALAMFRMEAGFATTGSLAQRNNNPGNIRFNNQEGATRGANGFARWNTMEEGISAYFRLLDRGYRSFIDRRDWAGLVNKYAPPVENDSDAYTRNIVGWMGGYRDRISA